MLLLAPLLVPIAIFASPPSPACPLGTKLVDGEHYEAVQHVCTESKGGYCTAFTPNVARGLGAVKHVRVCMDELEAPNVRGQKPIVMLDSIQAQSFCAARGKRLCSEHEWETACEGPDRRPWAYGWKFDESACNSDKKWIKFDAFTLMKGGDEAQAETERLWQGEPSGARATCVSSFGVADMNGNVEEWVSSSRPRPWPTALMGGFWAKWWTQCRGTNWAHEPTFRFYEVGFRCCAEPR